jgi:hypothetical protein
LPGLTTRLRLPPPIPRDPEYNEKDADYTRRDGESSNRKSAIGFSSRHDEVSF